jgi:hypothetical protein
VEPVAPSNPLSCWRSSRKASRLFGADFKPEAYVEREYEYARKHKYYMSARLLTVNDLYAFDPDLNVELEEFTDIVGRHFRQPPEGLGLASARPGLCCYAAEHRPQPSARPRAPRRCSRESGSIASARRGQRRRAGRRRIAQRGLGAAYQSL